MLVLLPAILCRGFVLVLQSGQPVFEKYLFLARHLADSQTAPFHSSPVYTVWIYITHCLAGFNIDVLRGLQAVFGIVSIVILMAVTTRLFGRISGMIAGILFGCCSPVLIYESDLVTTSADVFAQSLSLWMILRCLDQKKSGFFTFIVPGIWMGVSIGIHPNAFITVPLVLFVILTSRQARQQFVGNALGQIGWLTGIVLAVMPITMTNWVRSGEFVPVTGSGGAVFYSSNNFRATGLGYSPPPALTDIENRWMQTHQTNQPVEHAAFKYLAERAIGRNLAHREASSYYFNEALNFLGRSPMKSAEFWLQKLFWMFHNYEVLDTGSLVFSAMRIRSWLPFLIPGGVILVFGLFGFGISGLRDVRIRLIACFMLAHIATGMMFYVNGRLRVPLLLFFAIFAGTGIQRLAVMIRRRSSSVWLSLVALMGLVSLVSYPHSVIQKHATVETPSFLYSTLGLAALHAGEWDEAERHLLHAVSINPLSAREAWNNLAGIYARKGNEHKERLAVMRAAGIWSPNDLRSEAVYDQISDYEKRMAEARYAWFKQNHSEARRLFEFAVTHWQEFPDPWFNLAVVEAAGQNPDWRRVGDYCEIALDRGMKLEMESHRAHSLRLKACERTGDFDQAARIKNQLNWESSLVFSP